MPHPEETPPPFETCLSEFDGSELELITNQWSDERKVGEGGFGVVYKGVMPKEKGGDAVAVKKAKKQNDGGTLSAEFEQELRIFQAAMQQDGDSLRVHANLVNVVGFCKQPQAVLYEWVGGGDLQALLEDPERRQ